jgi:hypothetical protein
LVVLSSDEDARQESGAESSQECGGWLCDDGHCDQGFKNQTNLETGSLLVLPKTIKIRKPVGFWYKIKFSKFGKIERFSGLSIRFLFKIQILNEKQ